MNYKTLMLNNFKINKKEKKKKKKEKNFLDWIVIELKSNQIKRCRHLLNQYQIKINSTWQACNKLEILVVVPTPTVPVLSTVNRHPYLIINLIESSAFISRSGVILIVPVVASVWWACILIQWVRLTRGYMPGFASISLLPSHHLRTRPKS